MDDTLIVIMLKDSSTGFLEKELGSYCVGEYENLIVNAYALECDKKYKVYIKVSVDRDVEDWEFDAIYDYYDDTAIREIVTSIEEVEDCYNPTWEITFDFIESNQHMEDRLKQILKYHHDELYDVYTVIEQKKEEYLR